MTYCTNCGKAVEETASFCQNCGKSTKTKESFTSKMETEAEKFMANKDPFIAAILSFILPGLGQLYNGNFKNSLIFQAAYIVSWILGSMIPFFLIIPLGVLIISIYDAYTETEKIRNGTEPLKNATIKEIVIFLLWPIVVIVAITVFLLIAALLIAIIVFAVAGATRVVF